MATSVVAPPIIQPTPIIEKAPISRVIQPASKGITTPIVDTIESKLIGKPGNIKAQIKSQEISKHDMSGFYVRNGLTVQIVGAITPINISGQNGIQLYAKAWRNGQPLGFGKDGTIETERFLIFNPPILVGDPNGTITRTTTNPFTGEIRQKKLREAPIEAIKITLVDIINIVGKTNTQIVAGSVGNTTSTFYSGAGDGSVTNSAAAAWATVHDATAGSAKNDTTEIGYIMGDRKVSTTFYIIKVFLPFDTSAITDTDTISSATMTVFTSTDGGSGGAENMYLVATTQADTASLVVEDFDQAGTASLKSGGGSFSMDSTTSGTQVDVTLASPDTNVSKTGFTKLGIREYDHDVANVEATNNKYQSIQTSDTAGTTSDPKLVVVHAAAATPIEPLTDDDVYDE